MNTENMDILNSDKRLKTMPFRVPEGYFASLEEKAARYVSPRTGKTGQDSLWSRIAPYAAMAAMFTMIVAGGKAVIGQSVSGIPDTVSDGFFYSELMPAAEEAAFYEDYDYEGLFMENSSYEDIVSYLIYTGTSVETLMISDYE